jgi:hypothetical protein
MLIVSGGCQNYGAVSNQLTDVKRQEESVGGDDSDLLKGV